MDGLPPPVSLGDVISIVCPAGAANVKHLEDGIAQLHAWGLVGKVVRICETEADSKYASDYLSAPDSCRAKALAEAFRDPDTSAVLCARGGYGCLRLLLDPALRPCVFPVEMLRKKRFIGFSDITVLHCLFQNWVPGLVTLHAPMPATPQFLNASPAAKYLLKQALFGAMQEACPPLVGKVLLQDQYSGPPEVAGKLIGGNLCCLATLVGSSAWPNLDGVILALEDVGEDPYRVDRLIAMMQNVLQGRLWQTIAGLAIGDFGNAVSDVKSDAAVRFWRGALHVPFHLPMLAGLEFGHESMNRVLPIGSLAVLNILKGTLTFSQQASAAETDTATSRSVLHEAN